MMMYESPNVFVRLIKKVKMGWKRSQVMDSTNGNEIEKLKK